MRKRVVEFDDVINLQRETIYAERDKVLRNEELTDTVRAFLEEEVDARCDSHLAGPTEQWGMEGLMEALKRMGIGPDEVSEDELWDLHTSEAVAAHLRDIVHDKLDAREAEVGEEWSMVERFVLLRTIDSLWVEHLTEVDDMRRGIGLRGYAQQAPLNEFRREAYRLYEELRELIRRQVATSIFRVTVTRQPAPPPSGVMSLPGPGQPARAGTDGTADSGNGQLPGGARPAPRPPAAGQGGLRPGAGAGPPGGPPP